MVVFLGLTGLLWVVAGVFLLVDTLASTPRVAYVTHQIFLAQQGQLACWLLSFGVLFLGLGGVIEKLDRLPRREPDPKPEPKPLRLPAWVAGRWHAN